MHQMHQMHQKHRSNIIIQGRLKKNENELQNAQKAQNCQYVSRTCLPQGDYPKPSPLAEDLELPLRGRVLSRLIQPLFYVQKLGLEGASRLFCFQAAMQRPFCSLL